MWREYQDKRFLARLNRVLADNVLESDVVTRRDLMNGKLNPLNHTIEIEAWLKDLRFPPYSVDNEGKAHIILPNASFDRLVKSNK